MKAPNTDQKASSSTKPFAKKAFAKKKNGKNNAHAISFHRGTCHPSSLIPEAYHERSSRDPKGRSMHAAEDGGGIWEQVFHDLTHDLTTSPRLSRKLDCHATKSSG
jgi:hypothetical protein